MAFLIAKTFDFAYSHRVFTQRLDDQLSCGAENKCRHLHGHEGRVTVQLAAQDLDARGFVLDYTELNFFKKLLDRYFDHKTILGVEDPWFNLFKKTVPGYESLYYFQVEGETLGTIVCSTDSDEVTDEFWESFIITPFIPTSENLAKFFAKVLKNKFPTLQVSVTFSESAKTTAMYSE